MVVSTLRTSAGGRDAHALLSPPPPRTVEQLQACSTSRSFMASLLQTTLQAAGRGGKHFTLECQWQGGACTLSPSPPLIPSSSHKLARPVKASWQLQCTVHKQTAGRATRRQVFFQTSAGGSDKHAPQVSLRLTLSSSCRRARPVEASWRQALFDRVPAAEATTHFESATASHR